MAQRVIPTKFGEMVTNSPIGLHIMGECNPTIYQAIKDNGGYVLYINRDCRLLRSPDATFILTGLYLGEVDAELWREEQAHQAILPTDVDALAWFSTIAEKQCFCYTLMSGQRLLYVQNTQNGWESFLAIMTHVRCEGGYTPDGRQET